MEGGASSPPSYRGDNTMLITVIGRGHSGTRAISQTLSDSGVFMGPTLNSSWDTMPPEAMYEACRVIGRHAVSTGLATWDFDLLLKTLPTVEFQSLVRAYLKDILGSSATHKGWKLPETTLAYPWLVRMFPGIKYIFWIRDPRDSILGGHCTDELERFGIPHGPIENTLLKRAVSWKYQYDLVKATPTPANWIEVRLEDFVLRQEETLKRLEQFLGIPLVRIPVKADAVGRWKTSREVLDYDFLKPAMREYHYE
jgi:hypothetical protein